MNPTQWREIVESYLRPGMAQDEIYYYYASKGSMLGRIPAKELALLKGYMGIGSSATRTHVAKLMGHIRDGFVKVI